MPELKLAAEALIAFGALLLVGALTVMVRRLSFARRAQSVRGLVIACRRDDAESGGWLYTPTVRYQSSDGHTHDYTPHFSSSAANYNVGESVTVLVDPRRPAAPMIGRPGSLRVWMVPVVFALAGIVFAIIGSVLYLMSG